MVKLLASPGHERWVVVAEVVVKNWEQLFFNGKHPGVVH